MSRGTHGHSVHTPTHANKKEHWCECCSVLALLAMNILSTFLKKKKRTQNWGLLFAWLFHNVIQVVDFDKMTRFEQNYFG